jgi:hypothetical protein
VAEGAVAVNARRDWYNAAALLTEVGVKSVILLALAAGAACLGLACGGRVESAGPAPDKVVVQHLLVSFTGRLPGRAIARSQKEAAALAASLFERARKGEDFDVLVKDFTDDRPPGLYTMVGRGQVPGPGEYGRDQMVPGFSDLAFSLAVGEIGLCAFDGVRSPFGWHVVKRIQ